MNKFWPKLPTLLWLPPTFNDEIISSWFARIRHEHRLTYSALLKQFELKIPCDIDIASIRLGLEKITNGTNFPVARISDMANIFSWVERNQKINFALNRDKKGIAFIAFCPDCLSEPTPYWRASWRLRFYKVCIFHRKPMRLYCQHCSKRQMCNLTNLRISHTLRKIALRFCCHCSKSLTEEKFNRPHDSKKIEKHIVVQKFLTYFFSNYRLREDLDFASLFLQALDQFPHFLRHRKPNNDEIRLLRRLLRCLTLNIRQKISTSDPSTNDAYPRHELNAVCGTSSQWDPLDQTMYYGDFDHSLDYLSFRAEIY